MSQQIILPKEVKDKLDQGLELNIIDVRENEEVAQGMISGAKHIPLGELPVRHQEIEQTDDIILVCRSGNRSGKALEYLQMLGLKNLKNMEGGMLKWDKL
ncbi:rhodanese-like domain-containing protein [Chengkuizengella sediminis]|uniref:rhodanese-like domain-containing protein n=1 Tax=Chengkuizengella sediminis TaxID=1885917 RepID=UPI0013896337|nr:rhodanese-like domain-containing protein [Chengkuizengella sediminis]NDI33526.1 rhodanese-like domain-containing protein [Chengkuizengella sediminis]